MSQKRVTIEGIMTIHETAQPPLIIWGPSDPRPTNPIAGFLPGSGTFPPWVPQPPLVIWGPSDPRPTFPISGWDPGTGTFPKPTPPGGVDPGPGPDTPPAPSQPIAPIPIPGTPFVLYWTPVYGWVAVPASGNWGDVLPPVAPPTTPPTEPPPATTAPAKKK